ncbi:MAG: Mur ligase family protein [Anaerolineae bacterium]|nr:Mur ligase family protein [Anaerolineae bacterium]
MDTSSHPQFQLAADYIHSLDYVNQPQHTYQYAFDTGILRTRHLLARLGGAPTATTRCVLVAGSKGKGSTTIMIASLMAAAGYRVGAFTGPHLHRVTERFALYSPAQSLAPRPLKPQWMPEAQFVAYAEQIRAIIAAWDRPDLGFPTRFEAFTAMAYHWFEQQATDLAVMEIGLGGRRDAVNLAEPLVSVITNISLEHTQMLGNTLAEIAQEKSGILRANGYGVSAVQQAVVANVIRATAERLGSPIEFAEQRWPVTSSRHQIDPHAIGQWVTFPAFTAGPPPLHTLLPLLGEHQLQNASAALAAVNALRQHGFVVDDAAAQRGLAGVYWPGRFEVASLNPTIVIDGAHTPYSMQQLGAALRQYFGARRIRLVLGILRDKDMDGILRAMHDFANTITFVQPGYRRAAPSPQM